jgi:hypothetical protein
MLEAVELLEEVPGSEEPGATAGLLPPPPPPPHAEASIAAISAINTSFLNTDIFSLQQFLFFEAASPRKLSAGLPPASSRKSMTLRQNSARRANNGLAISLTLTGTAGAEFTP